MLCNYVYIALNILYRKAVLSGTTVLIHARLSDTVGRKRYMTATMTCAATGAVLAESTSLFILPKDYVPFPDKK